MKRTIGYWINKFGYRISLWNAYTNRKTEQASLFVSCTGPDGSEHTFNF